MENQLKERMNKALEEVNTIIRDIQENNLQHEQETLNFLDELNKLSVTF